MNILFDFIPFQYVGGVGGHASFTKRVLDEVLIKRDNNVQIFGLIDSKLPKSRNYNIKEIAADNRIIILDLAEKTVRDIIQKYSIDTFFISIGQLYSKYDLNGIQCKTIMFIHDIFDVERCDNLIDASIYDKSKDSWFDYIKRVMNLFSGRWKNQMRKCYDSIMPLYCSPSTIPYTVSEYTRQALHYYFPNISNEIKICYSPLKKYIKNTHIENVDLKQLISSNKPYLLMIAANRRYKNPQTVIKVFKRLEVEYPNIHLVTLKYGKTISNRHIDIDYLSDSDLENAYYHAKMLIYSSFFEGFGYPPIEAMRYSTPTIASNVTSIPEVIKNAGVYFSPFYPADLYSKIKKVLDNPEFLKGEMEKQYQEICMRQESDLANLIKCILS